MAYITPGTAGIYITVKNLYKKYHILYLIVMILCSVSTVCQFQSGSYVDLSFLFSFFLV
jgi:hypothetical protein